MRSRKPASRIFQGISWSFSRPDCVFARSVGLAGCDMPQHAVPSILPLCRGPGGRTAALTEQ